MKSFNEYKSVLAGIGFTLLITSLAGCDWGADSDMTASNAGGSPGYDAGYEFGIKLALLRQQQPGIELDEAFKGLLDALSETSETISSTEMCAMLQSVENGPNEVEPEPAESVQPPQTQESSHSFTDEYAALEASSEKSITLPSGVQYEVLKAGSGEPPQAGDSVVISYKASLDNGSVIDTTDDGGPRQMSLDNIVVPGLKEALLLMNEGARWQVVIPPNMGFGRTGSRMFHRRDLIYDIELISIDRSQPANISY